ncbi:MULTISPECIES: F0F1 ATP synthase subunit B [unclassified Oceanobacter]|uniref:F0F1 ATP synthase subunit B n=1 Tax=unclassified Oceanobacter TaxID=2620260 RepID=UPI0026E487A6|nr:MULTISPECIES: F0F1 ATP synthase subunit B [unclassified Oceanobacter]MDO6680832.1 F0F1 ATP synthase subunit B [Oceanobacter sp. 5_MG-2023]MDP2504601.1 F0F1 ATP synthase subunit B [Oceanobacter sp. 3_MG-2023]MDP2546946.1 F0F1 ATP synthase subunit B [Oceanobacter sp. 4_MG-2023]MDP2607770.1 F0F1 ATP synthase subunit B [Oceanobacter sp. 1_MG-2023]MDP2611046.1 F0F1 ATP synthase subunit B [Oceanobacter sp. 2_MG-2023]
MNMNLTMLGQLIAFAIFVWFCMKFVWPPLTSAMQERVKKIADGLDAANRAERDLELAQEKAISELRESKEKAAEIIEQANKRANQIIDEAKETARAEGDRLVAAAQAEVEQEVNRAKEVLRKQVSELAVAGATKILSKSVDASAHADLLNQLTEEL